MKQKSFFISRSRGFTLIELLIAITIIALLTVAGVVSYNSINKRTRDGRRSGDLQELRQQLEMYRTDNGFYPPVDTTAFGPVSDLASYLVPTYSAAISTDPKSSQLYYYKANGVSGGNYYGYCLCAMLETLASPQNTCTGETLPSACNYGIRNP